MYVYVNYFRDFNCCCQSFHRKVKSPANLVDRILRLQEPSVVTEEKAHGYSSHESPGQQDGTADHETEERGAQCAQRGKGFHKYL